MIDFVDMIFFHAAANPEKPAVVTSEAVLSYGMLRRGILSAQQQLRKHGLKPGDRAGVEVINAIGHMTLICALHREGIASVSIDRPMVDSVDETPIDALLTNAPVAGKATRMIPVDETWFNATPETEPGPNLAQQRDGDGLCRLILSSGTTGRPKVIALSFAAAQERLVSYSIRMSSPSWDRIVCMPGLSTNYGYSFAITTLWLGRTICFGYDSAVRELIIAYQAEMLVASTQQIAEMTKFQEDRFRRFDSLRSVHIGGAVAYAPLSARIRMLICSTLFCGYGSTEGGTIAYAPAESIFGMDRAVGVVVPWVEVEVVDDQKNPVEYGQPGEIRLRSLGQGYRYQKSPAGDYEMEHAEWFYPGDLGMLFRNGMMVISGRVNEIINRGGMKISPEKIEEEFKKHPGIDDVAAVGILDNFGLEQIWVAVTARGGGDIEISQMFDYCRKVLPLHVPDRIFQTKEIPRNRLGKVSREDLKEHLKKLEESHALAVR